jgi:hypothetical protein
MFSIIAYWQVAGNDKPEFGLWLNVALATLFLGKRELCVPDSSKIGIPGSYHLFF